jgi:hypothetical protein
MQKTRPPAIEREIRRLLRNYVRRHRHTARSLRQSLGSFVYGDCWDMSFELGHAIHEKFPREPLQMIFGKHLLVPLGPGCARRHGRPGRVAEAQEIQQHYALCWRGLVLDPSTHQFGLSRTVYPAALFRKRWRKVTLQDWGDVMQLARACGHI